MHSGDFRVSVASSCLGAVPEILAQSNDYLTILWQSIVRVYFLEKKFLCNEMTVDFASDAKCWNCVHEGHHWSKQSSWIASLAWLLANSYKRRMGIVWRTVCSPVRKRTFSGTKNDMWLGLQITQSAFNSSCPYWRNPFQHSERLEQNRDPVSSEVIHLRTLKFQPLSRSTSMMFIIWQAASYPRYHCSPQIVWNFYFCKVCPSNSYENLLLWSISNSIDKSHFWACRRDFIASCAPSIH